MVLPSENPDDYDSYRSDLLNSLNPKGELEAALAEKIVIDSWRLRRVPILEAQVFKREYRWATESSAERRESPVSRLEKLRQNAEDDRDLSFYGVTLLKTSSEELSNLWRYETTLIRSWLRMMHELERLQARREGKHVSAPAVMDVNVHLPNEPRPGIGKTVAVGKTNGKSAIK